MKNKINWDLCPNSRGYARKWSAEYFEKMHGISMNATHPFSADDYTTVETQNAVYRIKKSDINHPQIVEFLRKEAQ